MNNPNQNQTGRLFVNVVFFFAAIIFAAAAESSEIKIKVRPEITVAKPVSPLLLGGFIELAFGRTENLLAEKLYDRGFELPENFTFNRGWCTFTKAKPELEDWWHSGYEEHRWHLLRSTDDQSSVLKRLGDTWPAPPSGKFYAEVKNTSKTDPVSLMQDGIWIEAGVAHVFSGLFCDGTYFSAEPVSAKPVDLEIALLPDGQPEGQPLSSVRLQVDATTFRRFSVMLPAVAKSGRAMLVIRVPPGRKIACDNLSLLPADNIDGVRREVVEAFHAVPQAVIRFPGGCFASSYHWQDGIGDLDARPVDYHNWWDNPLINDFGTVEFLKFCRHVGSEPMLCVPVMFGDEVNAADWVAFCNKPGHRLQPGSGLAKPLPVKFWELDNETYRRMDAITYAHRCVTFSTAMKRVDPGIQTIMNCYWVYHKKLKEMLEIAGPSINLVNDRGGTIAELRSDLEELKRYNAAHHSQIGLCHSEYRANSYDLPVGKAVAGDNEGLNQPKAEDTKDTILAKASRWSYGLSVLCDFLDYQSFGGDFRFANFTESTDGWGENLINIAKTRVYPSAAGEALVFLRRQQMAWPLALDNTSLPKTCRVQAAWDKDKKNLIIFILYLSGNQQTMELDLSSLPAKLAPTAKLETVFADSPRVFVSETGPDPILRDSSVVRGEHGIYKIPGKPWSAIALHIPIQ